MPSDYPAAIKPPAEKIEVKEPEPEPGLHRLSWHEPKEQHDFRIVFVPDTSPEWDELKEYWNARRIHVGLPTAHLGLSPWPAAAAVVVAERLPAVRIKVPRGLPDPTELIPSSNPPTLGKWRLGKKLFHAPHLQAGAAVYWCAKCHNPEQGFTENSKLHSDDGKYNTLSLINVAYNRRQFWDGRVETLEETLVRGLTEDGDVTAGRSKEHALGHHNWAGFVRMLGETGKYHDDFKRVFGVDQPTQDTAAQALATYMRTILAGDSLFDRAADASRKAKNGQTLTEKDFLPLLGAAFPDEPDKKLTAENLKAMAKGYELFHGKAGCASCHSGPLFTDRDYYNTGGADDNWPPVGKETGRAVHMPVGRKEARWIGAFRTPTLRNLAKTEPYFHDGKKYALEEVVKYYDDGALHGGTVAAPHLAKVLRDRGKLGLDKADREALVMFLRALEGTPVDPFVTAPPK